MNEKVLDITNLSKSYGEKEVLKGISFEVYAGEIFGFIGPNGAGKSTLINIICGLTHFNSGQVSICGCNIKTEFKKAISNVGAVVENANLYSYMSGYQNLQYYAGLLKNVKKYDIDKIVKLVGLSNSIKQKVKTYSFGMRQRLLLAQAMLSKPKLLILDEPTNGLDVNGIIELRQTLKNLARTQNVAIFISSHILSEIEQTCDTVAIFNEGSILELRTLNSTANTNTKYLRIYVNYPNYAAKLLTLKFGVTATVEPDSVIIPYMPEMLEIMVEALKKREVVVVGTEVLSDSLEDFYLNTISNNGQF